MTQPLLASVVLAVAIASPGSAQFTQFTAAGSLAKIPKSPTERAKESAESARWNLGRIALDPRFAIRELGYYQNVFATTGEVEQVDDYRGSVGAGLAAHVDLGAKSLLSAYATPEYTWWRERSELSSLTLNWGAGWFGYFNRLTASASTSSQKRERPLSDEVEAPVQIEDKRLTLSVELELSNALDLFASSSSNETRHSSEIDTFVPGLRSASLDRDSENVAAGLAVGIRNWRLGVGIQSTEVTFLTDPLGRSNTGESPFARLEYRGERVDLDLTWIDREVEFDSLELGRQTISAGSGLVRLDLARDVKLSLYAARALAFAALQDDGYLVHQRRGASLATKLGRRLDATVFAETGTSDFRAPADLDRIDDLEGFGAQLRLKLTSAMGLVFYLRDSTWDSNLDEFDRSRESVGVELDLGEGLFPW